MTTWSVDGEGRLHWFTLQSAVAKSWSGCSRGTFIIVFMVFTPTYKNKDGTQSSSLYTQAHTAGVTTVTKVPRPLLGMKYKSRLTYFERNFLLTPEIGGVTGNWIFTANGLVVVNVTGTGHQPNGFDQMMQMYEHYTVISSKITVRVYNTDTTQFQHIGVYANHDEFPEPEPYVIVENGMGSFANMSPAGQGKSSITLTESISLSRFLGVPNIMSDKDCSGTVGTNPSNPAYWIIWACNTNDTLPDPLGVNVLIEYITLFTEPIKIALS